jgi:hypothetical protein
MGRITQDADVALLPPHLQHLPALGGATPQAILIGEWGSVRGKPGQRAARIAAAARSVKGDAQINALSYFDTQSWDEATGQPVDWRLNTEKKRL